MLPVKIWEGTEYPDWDTQVNLTRDRVSIVQQGMNDIPDVVVLDTEHAIDIAFTILKELCPTMHETLSQLNVDKDVKV